MSLYSLARVVQELLMIKTIISDQIKIELPSKYNYKLNIDKLIINLGCKCEF